MKPPPLPALSFRTVPDATTVRVEPFAAKMAPPWSESGFAKVNVETRPAVADVKRMSVTQSKVAWSTVPAGVVSCGRVSCVHPCWPVPPEELELPPEPDPLLPLPDPDPLEVLPPELPLPELEAIPELLPPELEAVPELLPPELEAIPPELLPPELEAVAPELLPPELDVFPEPPLPELPPPELDPPGPPPFPFPLPPVPAEQAQTALAATTKTDPTITLRMFEVLLAARPFARRVPLVGGRVTQGFSEVRAFATPGRRACPWALGGRAQREAQAFSEPSAWTADTSPSSCDPAPPWPR
jgi:hypothetical protein